MKTKDFEKIAEESFKDEIEKIALKFNLNKSIGKAKKYLKGKVHDVDRKIFPSPRYIGDMRNLNRAITILEGTNIGVGAGIGAGTGVFKDKEGKTHKLRNALIGAGVGAAAIPAGLAGTAGTLKVMEILKKYKK